MARLKIPEKTVEDWLSKKVDNARESSQIDARKRNRSMSGYFRRPLGNEKPGRNNMISSAVFSQVQGVLPHQVRQFLSSDDKIEVTGPKQKIADALKVKCQEDIRKKGGFQFIYTLLMDGDYADNGSGVVWWKRTYDDPTVTIRDGLTREKLDNIKAQGAAMFKIEDVQHTDWQATPGEGPPDPVTGEPPMRWEPTFTAKLSYRKLKESGPVLEAIPPEQLILEKAKRTINDRHFCGRIQKRTLGELKNISEERKDPVTGEPFFHNLGRAAKATAETGSKEQIEQQEREELIFDYVHLDDTIGDSPLSTPIEVIEGYCQMPVDGKLKSVIVWRGNGITLRIQENRDGFVPLFTWTPYPIPHKVRGQSIASTAVDKQNILTQLARGYLDSIAFYVDKHLYVKDPGADLLGMTHSYPGKRTKVDPDGVKESNIEPINDSVLKGYELIKGDMEESGPSPRINQGLLPDSSNKTAKGISLLQKAAFTKVDMINLIFAETCLVDIYQKLITLYQKNLDGPIEVKVAGKVVVLTRADIQGDYTAQANMGVEVDFNEREFNKLRVMLNDVYTAYERMGEHAMNLFPPDKIHSIWRRLVIAAGYRDVSEFLTDPEMDTPAGPGIPASPEGQYAGGRPDASPDEAIFSA